MNWQRFGFGSGFVVFSVASILFGLDIHPAGRLFQFLVYMIVWALISTLIIYPIKTRRAAKKQKAVDDAKRAAEIATKKAKAVDYTPSFAAVRKGVRKS
jgi:predicted secreted protein